MSILVVVQSNHSPPSCGIRMLILRTVQKSSTVRLHSQKKTMDGDIHHSCMIFLLYIRYRNKATPPSLRHGRSMAKKVIDTKQHHRCCCIRYCVKNSIDEWMKQTMDRRTQVTTGSYRLLKTRHDQRKSNVIRIVILIYMIQGLCGIESRIEEQYGRARNPSIRQSMGNTFGCIPWLFWIQQHLVYQHRLLLVSSFVRW